MNEYKNTKSPNCYNENDCQANGCEHTKTPNREELLNHYIDVATRLEQCGKLRKYDIGRRLQNELYDHQQHLEESIRELEKALRETNHDA